MDLFFYLGLSGLIFIFCLLYNYMDFDFFARIIVGKSFLQTGSVFHSDFYSYGTTHEFIDHEWFSGVIFQLIIDYFGEIGLFFFKFILIFLTFFFVIKIIKLEKNDSKLYILPFFFVIQSISYNIFSTIRCQSFSFLFFVLYLYILNFSRIKNNYKVLWTIPVLNIIWANLHGGFAMGLILISIFIFGEFLNKSKIKPYILVLVSTFATSLINPWGFKYLNFVFEALKLNRVHISEWQSAFFDSNYIFTLIKFKFFFLFVFLLLLFALAGNIKQVGLMEYYKKCDKTKILIILFVTLIALKSQRFHVFFSYVVLALCYCDFYEIFNKKLPSLIDNFKEILLSILILLSGLSHFVAIKIVARIPNEIFPVKCVEFIQKNKIPGNVFTIFHTGSYVAYKLYPDNLVFMDGRYEEVYDNNLIDKMGAVFLAKPNFEQFFNMYKTDILILDKNYPVYKAMKEKDDWFLAYEDNSFALFLKEKFHNERYIMPVSENSYYENNKFYTKIDWLR